HLSPAGTAPVPPEWKAVEAAAAEMLSFYDAVNREQANLTAIFDARPFPDAGLAPHNSPVYIDFPAFGKSLARSRPLLDLVAKALPVTLLLNHIAFPIIYFIAVPCGMLAAVRRGGFFDSLSGIFFIGLWSFPLPLAGVL